jgi:hypothetical protein
VERGDHTSPAKISGKQKSRAAKCGIRPAPNSHAAIRNSPQSVQG